MWSGSKPLAYDLEATHLMRRRVQGQRLRLMARVGAMALAAAVLLTGALHVAAVLTAPQPFVTQTDSLEDAPQSWSDINHPIALYDLSGTDFAKLPHSLKARRHQPDGAREDILTFGSMGSAKPYLQLSILRTGQDTGRLASRDVGTDSIEPLADDLARLAGVADQSVTALHGTVAVTTRLGPMTVGDLQLWDGGVPTPCTGLRGFPGGQDGLRLLAIACGASGKPVVSATLACVVDRIDLVSAGDDRRLRAIFVAAERETGSSCSEGRVHSGLMTAAVPRVTWLDRNADLPPLRGILEASANRH